MMRGLLLGLACGIAAAAPASAQTWKSLEKSIGLMPETSISVPQPGGGELGVGNMREFFRYYDKRRFACEGRQDIASVVLISCRRQKPNELVHHYVGVLSDEGFVVQAATVNGANKHDGYSGETLSNWMFGVLEAE